MYDEIEEKTVILPPFQHFIMTVGEIPTSYLESMTYYEMLVWFTNYLGNTVIPAINENGEAVTELQNLFVELQTYVNNYFENLDVQEEINNKLDDMVEDGTMNQIINQEIFGQINSDISDLKEYTSLKNMPTLFIGDSYTNAVTSYAEIYKSTIGLDNSKFFKYARGGAGFHATGTGGKTFIDLLNDAITAMTPTQKTSIKQIIVGSCLNDANYSSTVTQIKTAVNEFMTLVHSNYPNAKVYIIACGYRLGTTSGDITARYNLDNIVMNALLDCDVSYNPPIVINHSNLWLRNGNWFQEDGMHPNSTGQKIIAEHLIRGLQNSTDVKYNEFDISCTIPGDEDETFTFKGNIVNDVLTVYLPSNQRLYNLTSIPVNTLQQIGTWSSNFIHTATNYSLDIPCVLRIVLDGPVDNWVNAFLRFAPDGKLYFYVFAPTAFSNPINFTINRFNVTTSMIYK